MLTAKYLLELLDISPGDANSETVENYKETLRKSVSALEAANAVQQMQ
jgi:hypothetical protein